MSSQIENGLKSVVSAALATALTLIIVTGISNAVGPHRAHHHALTAHSPAAVSAPHGG